VLGVVSVCWDQNRGRETVVNIESRESGVRAEEVEEIEQREIDGSRQTDSADKRQKGQKRYAGFTVRCGQKRPRRGIQQCWGKGQQGKE